MQAVSHNQDMFPVPPHRTVLEVFPHTALRQVSSVSFQPYIFATFLLTGTILSPGSGLAESRSFRFGVFDALRNTAIVSASIRIGLPFQIARTSSRTENSSPILV